MISELTYTNVIALGSLLKIFILCVFVAHPAGCHVVAPSDMMDNRVAAIKQSLLEADLGDKVRLTWCVCAVSPVGGSILYSFRRLFQ